MRNRPAKETPRGGNDSRRLTWWLGLLLLGWPCQSLADDPLASVVPLREKFNQAVENTKTALRSAIDEARDVYLRKVEQAVTQAQADGDLDAALNLKAEQEKIQRTSFPTTATVPTAVKGARLQFVNRCNEARADGRRSLKNSFSNFLTDLEDAEKERTRNNQIAAALAIRSYRLEIQKQGPPAVESLQEQPRNGLLAEFFSDDALQKPVGKRVDPDIDIQWGGGGLAPFPDVPADHFSVRWTGWIKAPVPGDYKFTLVADDGFRLAVDGTRVIDSWKGSYYNLESATVRLTGQPQKIQIEYFEGDGGNWIGFWWQPPGSSSPVLVPSNVLFPDEFSAYANVKRVVPDHGLAVVYSSVKLDRQFGRKFHFRTEANWQMWAPIPGAEADAVSHYTGFLLPPKTGRDKLVARADDQLRVIIDGNLVLQANFDPNGSQTEGHVDLTADTAHALRIEYSDIAHWGMWYLYWVPPDSQSAALIPLESLYPTESALPSHIAAIRKLTPQKSQTERFTKGMVMNGTFQSGRPTSKGLADIARNTWKFTVAEVTNETFAGIWEWDGGALITSVEGKIDPQGQFELRYVKSLKGYDVAVEGGTWKGTIASGGKVSGRYTRPSANRVGEIEGTVSKRP